jgi:serine/threonine protein kinase
MSESNRCPECSAELPRGATEGLCPKCLMGAALGSGDDIRDDAANSPFAATTPQTGGFVPPHPEEIAPHFPHLEILELLGHGGMGAVYKARQTKLDRLVALKIIRPESADDPAFAERFMREARTLARLNHPNIVAVHDFGETGELYFFVMEYVDGLNLRQLMQAGELQPEQTLELVPQICEALQFAHDEGIIHRDIKPENIPVDSRGKVKIADFGLARLVRPPPMPPLRKGGRRGGYFTLTGTHQVMETPRYMAPEQMEGSHQVDHRADIYSLGVVFYEMLTGEIPMGQFDPPSRKAAVDARLDEVVLRALAREPERRYQQAGDVRSDVEAITSTHSFVSQSGMSDVSYPHGASTILEQGVGRIVESVQPQNFRSMFKHPATPGILAMLLSLGGVVTILFEWGMSLLDGNPIYGYDYFFSSAAGLVFFILALALFAGGTSQRTPTWRSWTILLTGVLTFVLIAAFYETIPHARIWVRTREYGQ